MRNKNINKYWFLSVLDIAISSLLTYITIVVIKKTLMLLYDYASIGIVNLIWRLWNVIRYESLGTISYLFIIIPLFLMYYWILTHRKMSDLGIVIEETKIMASGDLEHVIDIKPNNYTKNLADNINSISSQLKERTIEEKRAQQTKNDLITNVSHDLRTPLTSIIGYLEVMESGKYRDEVELMYYIDIVYEKAKRLNLLINDLFELTKMKNSNIDIKKSKINLGELIGQVTAYLNYQFEKANMEPRLYFYDENIIVNADSEKLVRVFENLLTNAIKYGKDGHYVDITSKIEGNMAVIKVINYGQSISDMDLPYIFDRFYRVEKSRNSKVSGSGLGLAITKSIIELHNGKISAYSSEEKTVFEIKLPIDE
ncbi:HAMP domain-containing sensor histidine kinase [Clostridium sp. LIBA-8841]|uniref:sensor histidine kinase n=1 Tax=Clostridium sp. LIBA-8841 TaxID=2987530 RepID=UPI002AC457FD|nr:HAMP domain-containing sensor histidine kinase [Clostridium sp. LIBA-8841]MDZ5253646.1 HAMP domain-containing histidine kinase [Clostridium sp. LIBA-8841]